MKGKETKVKKVGEVDSFPTWSLLGSMLIEQ